MDNNLTSGNANNKIKFLNILRACAALLVVYDHLVATWLDNNNLAWLPLNLIRKYITGPLGIIQDFGFFGVVLFFLLSGFIITHVIQYERKVDFIIKRILRIYPPLIFSIVIIFLSHTLYGFISKQPTFIVDMSFKDFALASTLINYFTIPQNPINGVAWTLVIEMLFYVLCFLLHSLLRKKPIIAIFSGQIICLSILLLSRRINDNFFLFAASVAYLPFLMIGQIVYLFKSKHITLPVFIISLITNYVILMQGILIIHVNFYDVSNSYLISFSYAFLVFIIAMLIEDYIKIPKIMEFFSNISYSLYLNHGTVGMLTLSLLHPHYGYTLSFLIALNIVIIVSYLSWRFIEKPSQSIARKIIKKI